MFLTYLACVAFVIFFSKKGDTERETGFCVLWITGAMFAVSQPVRKDFFR
jgi:hypothetical protein